MESQADAARELTAIDGDIIDCRLCPRLVAWREAVAAEKRRSYAHWTYWARAVPNFGDYEGDRLIVGLAPAAHGANRTGRMFTGDRSGEWLYRALYKAGVANRLHSEDPSDGLQLKGVLISASAHCAPPDNKPTPQELATCRQYLVRTLGVKNWKAVLCLGGMAWANVLRTLGEPPSIKFGHGITHAAASGTVLVGSYHPSQQNTFTGKLTEEMLDEVVQTFLMAGEPRTPV